MPDTSTISNTSPLFYLHELGRVDLLRQFYGRILVPKAVLAELAAGRRCGESVPDLTSTDWVEPISVKTSDANLHSDLGRGESEAIALALARRDSLLIMDDLLGRQVAARLGIRTTGTLGILIRARKAGRLPSLGAAIGQLEDAGMWLSPRIIHEALRLAGE